MFALIPGAGASEVVFSRWTGALPGPVSIVQLPGQGGPRLPDYGLDSIVAWAAGAIAPGTTVIGESIGGLVALGLAGRGYRAIAVDPPLTTGKQWRVQRTLTPFLRRPDVRPEFRALMAGLLGISPDADPVDYVYYGLLERLARPVDIVTGTQPLWRAEGDGCVMDAADLYVLRQFPQVRLHTVPGAGHQMLRHRFDDCRALILDLIAQPD